MRPESLRVWLLSSLCCLLAACASPAPLPGVGDSGTPTGTGQPTPETPEVPDSGTPDAGPASTDVARSSRNNVRFKGPERLASDFATALSLPVEEVCNELGRYSCTSYVHTVTLGGVEPYGNGFYEPLPSSGVTSPIAVDRVTLAACGRRVSLDVATPATAVIFKGISLDAQRRLSDPDGPAVKAAITALYQRALLRDPTSAETEALVQLAHDIAALAGDAASARPGVDWMKSACFVVLSSTESVFY